MGKRQSGEEASRALASWSEVDRSDQEHSSHVDPPERPPHDDLALPAMSGRNVPAHAGSPNLPQPEIHRNLQKEHTMTDMTTIPTADLTETLVSIMMDSDADLAQAQARACLEAATMILAARFDAGTAIRALGTLATEVQARTAPTSAAKAVPEASPATPAQPSEPRPSDHAFAALNMLRDMPRDVAHERARAVVAGSGAYLHETFGPEYASAVLAGTLDAAADHGKIMRGGRGSNVTLH